MELPPLGPRPSFLSRSGSPSPPFHYIWQRGSDHTLCRIFLRNFWPSLCPLSQHSSGDPGGGIGRVINVAGKVCWRSAWQGFRWPWSQMQSDWVLCSGAQGAFGDPTQVCTCCEARLLKSSGRSQLPRHPPLGGSIWNRPHCSRPTAEVPLLGSPGG